MKRLRKWMHDLWFGGEPIIRGHHRVRCSRWGTRYVLVADLFLDPETVELMMRAADPKTKGIFVD